MKELLYDILYNTDDVILDFFDRLIELGLPITVLEISGLIYTFAFLAEMIITYSRNKRKDLWEPMGNLSCYAFTTALETTFYGIIVIGAVLVMEQVAIWAFPVTLATWIIGFIIIDFNYYWYHRIQHEVRALWGVHSVHHSSEEFDLTTGVRLFVLGDIILWIYFAPLILIGFDAAQILTCMLIIFSYAAWMHIGFIKKIESLHWISWVFCTPSLHRVHHGTNPQYIDKNYGGVFIIWDRLYGTYEEEVEPVRYGISTPVNTSNALKYNFSEFISIYQDLKAANSWRERRSILLKGPSWKVSTGT